jgi:hypothetical protein
MNSMKPAPATGYLRLQNAPQLVVDFLNREDSQIEEADREELGILVKLWLECGFNMNKMRQTIDRRRLKSIPVEGTFHLVFTAEGRPVPVPYPAKESTHAQGIFLQLLLNPDSERLCGPCGKCGRYFLKETRHRRAFCSRACLTFSTALKATQKARQKKSAERLGWAAIAIADWQRSKCRGSWKAWTVERLITMHGEHITQKSLTRWVNEGKLIAPNDGDKP